MMLVTISLGAPDFDPADVKLERNGPGPASADITVMGENGRIGCLAFENTHAVVYVGDVSRYDMETAGNALADSPGLPVNVVSDFSQIMKDGSIKVRSWQMKGELRSSLESAGAAAVAAVLDGSAKGPEVNVNLEDGDVTVLLDMVSGKVTVTGAKEIIYSL